MTNDSGHLVLIVGCGELGSRHLQAIASSRMVRQIEVIDPRPEALELGRKRLNQILDHRSRIKVRWLKSLKDATKNGDLCVDATQSIGRCDRIIEVSESLGYTTFLIEKIVSQSVDKIESLLDYSQKNGISIWVNCQGRARPFHLRVKSIIGHADPITYSVIGSNHGLATNGIHHSDMFVFYDGSEHIKSAGSHVDQVLHPSKRGIDLFDLSGTLQGYSDKGSRFSLNYSADPSTYEHFTIATRRYRCIIDHFQGWAIESDEASNWEWRSVSYKSNAYVSETTTGFANDIFDNGQCGLPTLKESLISHRFILNELRPHFSSLIGRDIDQCPIT